MPANARSPSDSHDGSLCLEARTALAAGAADVGASRTRRRARPPSRRPGSRRRRRTRRRRRSPPPRRGCARPTGPAAAHRRSAATPSARRTRRRAARQAAPRRSRRRRRRSAVERRRGRQGSARDPRDGCACRRRPRATARSWHARPHAAAVYAPPVGRPGALCLKRRDAGAARQGPWVRDPRGQGRQRGGTRRPDRREHPRVGLEWRGVNEDPSSIRGRCVDCERGPARCLDCGQRRCNRHLLASVKEGHVSREQLEQFMVRGPLLGVQRIPKGLHGIPGAIVEHPIYGPSVPHTRTVTVQVPVLLATTFDLRSTTFPIPHTVDDVELTEPARRAASWRGRPLVSVASLVGSERAASGTADLRRRGSREGAGGRSRQSAPATPDGDEGEARRTPADSTPSARAHNSSHRVDRRFRVRNVACDDAGSHGSRHRGRRVRRLHGWQSIPARARCVHSWGGDLPGARQRSESTRPRTACTSGRARPRALTN